MNNERGFTLIETLVAIAVLMTVITIPYYSIEHALLASYNARDELTAAELAQEGIEVVRGIRDGNFINNEYCLTNQGATCLNAFSSIDNTTGNGNVKTSPSPANCLAPNTCAVDAPYEFSSTVPAVRQCTNATCSTLPLYLTSSGWYTEQISGTKTQFTRAVQLTPVRGSGATASEMKVTVTVYWTTNHQTFSTQEVDYLDNWLSPS